MDPFLPAPGRRSLTLAPLILIQPVEGVEFDVYGVTLCEKVPAVSMAEQGALPCHLDQLLVLVLLSLQLLFVDGLVEEVGVGSHNSKQDPALRLFQAAALVASQILS